MREAVPIYSHGRPGNMFDLGECRAWVQKVREAPEGFKAFKFEVTSAGVVTQYPFTETLSGSDFKKVAKAFANLRTAMGDDLDIALHCHSQFDLPSAIGLCKAVEPVDPLWAEDPLNVPYSEAWLELKRATRAPILTGEKTRDGEWLPAFLGQWGGRHHPPGHCIRWWDNRLQENRGLCSPHANAHGSPQRRRHTDTVLRVSASVWAVENFFKLENMLGERFDYSREKMAAGKEPVIRMSVMQFPEGPGLGLQINEDWLRQHMAKGETWWG